MISELGCENVAKGPQPTLVKTCQEANMQKLVFVLA